MKRARGVVLAGDASGVGGEQLLLRGRVLTPASSLRRSWAWAREEIEVRECGELGQQDRETRGREERAAAWLRVIVYLGTAELGSTAPSSSCSAVVLRPPGGARESVEWSGE